MVDNILFIYQLFYLKAARYFAGVIFGSDQAEKLIDFYHGDGLCVINLCAKYMTGRLNKLIAKVQKKSK